MILTDAECVYRDFGLATQKKIPVIDATALSGAEEAAFMAQLPAGGMRPKVEAGLQFARSSGGDGWAAIGRMEALPEVLSGTSGTRIICNASLKSRSVASAALAKEVAQWERDDVEHWLRDVAALPSSAAAAVVAAGFSNGEHLIRATVSSLLAAGLNWAQASAVAKKVCSSLHGNDGGKALRWVDSEPYLWPHDGLLSPASTALLMIDMQHSALWNSALCSAIEPAALLLDGARQLGFRAIHTREGHDAALSDCSELKLWRSRNLPSGAGNETGPAFAIGESSRLGRRLVRGEEGWQITPQLAPVGQELVLDKTGKSAFFGTNLERVLRGAGVSNLVLAGVCSNASVVATLWDASDRGFDCVAASDATAAPEVGLHRAVLRSVRQAGGALGAVADTHALLRAMRHQ